MSNVTALSHDEPREQSYPVLRDRTRLGVLLPLCVFVALAIMCIVVAAFTSAQRANEVAIERDKKLFTKTIANRGAWSLRKLKSIIDSDAPAEANVPVDLDQVLQRVGSGLKTLIDHDFVLVTDASGHLVHSFIKRDSIGPDWLPAAFPELAPALAYLHGENRAAPNNLVWLTEPKQSANGSYAAEAAFLQMLMGRTAIIAGIVTGTGDAKTGGGKAPIVLTLQFIDDALLSDVGARLQLANLRKIGEEPIPAGDHVFSFHDQHSQAVMRFVWTPERPEIGRASCRERV